VRCNDARFSCPAASTCAKDFKCLAADGSSSNAVVNVDAAAVAKYRDFGTYTLLVRWHFHLHIFCSAGFGMQPMAGSICGAIANNFQLPSFCQCYAAPLGGNLSCSVGLDNYISIGASAWIMPCASPANVGYYAYADILGWSEVRDCFLLPPPAMYPSILTDVSQSIGQTWTANWGPIDVPIPGATFSIGIASAWAQAEINGTISGGQISAGLGIGACAKAMFVGTHCDFMSWLPVPVISGSFDFSSLCL
jgi:hypothetical protein